MAKTTTIKTDEDWEPVAQMARERLDIDLRALAAEDETIQRGEQVLREARAKRDKFERMMESRYHRALAHIVQQLGGEVPAGALISAHDAGEITILHPPEEEIIDDAIADVVAAKAAETGAGDES